MHNVLKCKVTKPLYKLRRGEMKKITLITGAGRGIGFGIARLFAKRKHNLILTIRKKNQMAKVLVEKQMFIHTWRVREIKVY